MDVIAMLDRAAEEAILRDCLENGAHSSSHPCFSAYDNIGPTVLLLTRCKFASFALLTGDENSPSSLDEQCIQFILQTEPHYQRQVM